MAQFIVVGAGPAGCAFAATVAGSEHHQAILIESGRERPSSQESQRRWPLLGDASRNHYRGGSGLGGSSLVNAGVMGPVAGHQELGRALGVPVSIVTPGPMGCRLLRATSDAERVAVLGPDGGAVSAADALDIESMTDGGQLTIMTETTVEAIMFEGRRAVGVKTSRGELFGDCVVLAAGAITTPILLADSGVDTAGIGEGLRDHPALMVAKGDPFGVDARARPTGLAPIQPVSPGDPVGHLLAIDGTIKATSDTADAAMARREPADDAVGEGDGAVMIGLLNSRRVGSVRRSPETGRVIVDLGPSVDTAALAELWSRARRVLDSEALAAFVRDAFVDDWGTRYDDLTGDQSQAMAWAQRAATGYFHAAGTCSRAVDDEGSVLGYSSLVIADISAVNAPPVWPMAASLARGREVARRLIAPRRR